MSNTISIAFKNGDFISPVLYDHWGGKKFLNKVKEFYEQLPPDDGTPIGRKNPGSIMVHFILWMYKGQTLENSESAYLEKEGDEGDNMDNGHHICDLLTGKITGSL